MGVIIMAISGRIALVRNSLKLIFKPNPVIDIVSKNDVPYVISDIIVFDTTTFSPMI